MQAKVNTLKLMLNALKESPNIPTEKLLNVPLEEAAVLFHSMDVVK